MVVTIDGPAGAGKSTVARRLAAELGFAFLDTGALYRAVALAAAQAGVDPDDEAEVAAWVEGVGVDARPQDGRFLVTLRGRDVEPEIRTEAVGALASRLSALPAVRTRLLGLQRAAGASGDLVCEGRDMGTVVFPQAEAKFFLTADDQERARRRWLEEKQRDPAVTLEDVLARVRRRDAQDQGRAHAPLRPAPDAHMVDTTRLGLADVVALLRRLVDERRSNS